MLVAILDAGSGAWTASHQHRQPIVPLLQRSGQGLAMSVAPVVPIPRKNCAKARVATPVRTATTVGRAETW